MTKHFGISMENMIVSVSTASQQVQYIWPGDWPDKANIIRLSVILTVGRGAKWCITVVAKL